MHKLAKQRWAFLLTVALTTAWGVAQARNTTEHFPLADVLAMPEAKMKLDPAIQFYLKGQSHPEVHKDLGEGVTNRKTDSAGRSDEHACRWAALDALIELQKTAKEKGANAVVDVVSYYKKQPFESATQYECHAGAFVAGVALKGEYATVAAGPADPAQKPDPAKPSDPAK